MMKDIEIKINRETRMVDLSKSIIGNDGENLQGNLVFSFTDDFVKGQGRLEYVTNREKKYALLLKGEDNYYIPIKSVMTKEGQIDMQLVVTEGTDANEIPIFKSNVFYVTCKESINAEIEEDEGYYQWIEIANTKLNEIDEVVEEVETKLANGEFNGKDGKDGKDFTYEDFTEEQLENLRGPQGEPGKDGEDYVLTDEDKQEITNVLDEKYETYLDTITPKATAKGELVHITDALGLPTFENKIDGNVKQITTTGKQLIDFSKIQGHASAIPTFKDDVLTIVGTENSTIYNSASIAVTTLIKNNPSKTLYLKYDKLETLVTANGTIGQLAIFYNDGTSATYNALILQNGTIRGYAIPSDTSNIETATLGIYTSNNSPAITNTITITKPMLTFDENAEYEPYTGGQASPNPDYPQEIEVIEGDLSYKVNGKNLLKLWEQTITKNGITVNATNNGITLNGTATENTFIVIYRELENTSFFNDKLFSIKEEKSGVLVYIDYINDDGSYNSSQNASIIGTKISVKSKKMSFTITIDKGTTLTNYIVYPMVSLEGGEYEPYQEQIVPLDLKGNWVGAINENIKDYLVTDKKKYWLVKNVGKVVLDGSIGGYNAVDNWFYISFASLGITPKLLTIGKTFISDYFIDRDLRIDKTVNGISYTNITHLIIRNVNLTNADEYKTYLSENKPEVYYPLATPEIIDLGELPEPIKTFEGVNNIQVLANLDTEIEVTYALDVKKYYDNKLAEISAQII